MKIVDRLLGISDEAGQSIATQIACHQELGWTQLEMRSVEGKPLAVYSAGERDALCAQVKQAGLSVPAIASQIGNWQSTIGSPTEDDVIELEALAGWAAQLDTKMLRVMSYRNDGRPEVEWRDAVVARLKALSRRAAEHGLMLAHENCAGWGGQNADTQLELLERVGEDNFQLLFDVGNGLSYGYTSLDMLRKNMKYVAHVHLKDGVKDAETGEVHYTLPGAGEADLAQCISELLANGYEGLFSIEPHLNLIPHMKSQTGDEAQMKRNYIAYGQQAGEILQQHQGLEHAV